MKRLHILVVPGYKLFPIDSGGAHHQLVYLARQQEQHSIELVVTPKNISEEDLDDFKKQFPGIKLIPVGYTRSNLVTKGLSSLKKAYRKILKKGFPYRLKKVKELRDLILRDYVLVEAVAQLTRNKTYDLIQVEHSINMGLIELLPDEAVKLFVHHEISHTRIHSDLVAMGYSITKADHFSALAKKLEIEWLNKYDGIITQSGEDKNLLEQNGITKPVKVARPFSYFDEELEKIYDPLIQPHLVFVGGETHFPNKEGLNWFLQEVYPRVQKKRNDVKLLITGNWSDGFKKQYAGDDNIHFTGFVGDLKTVFKNGVLIIPIRIGSGIRVKAISALGNGVPVISTSFAMTGIPGIKQNENLILADTADLFSKAIGDLMDNPELRKKISDESFELARAEFNRGLFVQERNLFYQELFDLHNTKTRS